MNLTNEQKQAIFHDKGNILVSASAGSGKTFVMIQRLIRLIIEEKVDVKNVLAVTFTKLAASEMKEKLIKALTQEINAPGIDEEHAKRLKEQLSEVPTASISTFHSFCNDLIKNYFYELGLDASFRIVDEVKAKMLMESSIDTLFEKKYERIDEEFKNILSIFIKKRNDDAFKRLIISLYEFFASEAYPEKEGKRVIETYSEEGYQKIKTAFFEHYLDFFIKAKADLQSLKEEAFALEITKYIDFIEGIIAFCDGVLASKDLFEMAINARGAKFDLPRIKKTDDENVLSLKRRLSNIKSLIIKEADYVEEKFFDEEGVKRDFLSMRKSVEALIGLCFEFGSIYSEAKREENVVDYSDLEHFALELLDKEEIRASVSESFEYIFVDEYQDTNGVQEEILSRLSRDNMFMVGDIKQCIYAFRGCNHKIFEKKFERFLNGEGTAVSLNSNFRSSKAILKTVNAVFSEIMTEETCGINYSKNIMTGGNGEDGYSAIHYVVNSEEKDKSPVKRVKRGVYSVKENLGVAEESEILSEGVMIASAIKEVINTPLKLADGTERMPEYKDIVILSRSLTDYTKKLAEALLQNDIPVSSEDKKDVGVYPEIRLLVALLSLIDCARQDVPLCAVMRGPIGNFSDEELAEIRLLSSKKSAEDNTKDERSFYEACEYYIQTQSDELAKKLKEFFDYLQRLRFLSDFESAGDLLFRVIREKELDFYYLAKDGGESRIKRINKFVSEASSSENPYTVKEFLKRIRIDDVSVTEAGDENAVRIMSIHSSKGLEFPIVFVCGLNRKFNEKDSYEEVIFDKEYGVSIKTYDSINMKAGTNIFREFLKKRYRSHFVKEEMRILYVALTRAKSRLYLTQTANSLPEYVSALDVKDAFCYGKMISRNKAEEFAFSPQELKAKLFEKRENTVLGSASDEAMERQINKHLSFVYPYNINVASKNSVTALLKEDSQPVLELFSEYDNEEAITRGNAYHRFMELLNFEKCALSQIIEQKQVFLESGLLSEDEFGLIDDEKVCSALSNECFHIRGAEYYKELPFEALIPTCIINGEGEDEILVQGVIDLIAFCEDGIWIIDYKVSKKSAEKLKRDYKKQLDLYAFAAERITGKKVKRKTLINLMLGESVEV